MDQRFLGLPLPVWGAICLVVAGIFTAIWPSNRAVAGMEGWRLFLLRWGHALVWVLLALMCFLRAAGNPGGIANLVGLSALFVYLGFVASFTMK